MSKKVKLSKVCDELCGDPFLVQYGSIDKDLEKELSVSGSTDIQNNDDLFNLILENREYLKQILSYLKKP